jgi:mannose-6-phosphate isomerase-like protein (cupin superfamily)
VSDATVYRFEDMEWHVPVSQGTDLEDAARAGEKGVRRRLMAQGDSGFYTQIVEMPPNFDAPAHSHSHSEVFMVLDGSCTMNGETLGQYDTTVIPEGRVYGFTAGPKGLRFLVMRTGDASFSAAS